MATAADASTRVRTLGFAYRPVKGGESLGAGSCPQGLDDGLELGVAAKRVEIRVVEHVEIRESAPLGIPQSLQGRLPVALSCQHAGQIVERTDQLGIVRVQRSARDRHGPLLQRVRWGARPGG